MRRARTVITALVVVWSSFPGLSGCGKDPDLAPAVEEWPVRSLEFSEAGRYFGELRVADGEFEAEAARKPWSAWWYPIRDNYLFQSDGGRMAPLEKYDRFVQKSTGTHPGSVAYERDRIYDPAANTWEGLCNAWSVAAIMEPEPTQGATVSGIQFGVGDLKALLIKSYEKVRGTRSFGQRYNGDRVSNFDDIYPDQFHALMVTELMKRNRAFIIDKDPGVPVWNTPVWKVQYTVQRDEADARVAHVRVWLYGASPFVNSYDYVGTLSVVFEYTYDLMGKPLADGSLEVHYGQWTGSSRDFHPDFATVLPDGMDVGMRESVNIKIQAAMVDQLFQKAGLKPMLSGYESGQ